MLVMSPVLLDFCSPLQISESFKSFGMSDESRNVLVVTFEHAAEPVKECVCVLFLVCVCFCLCLYVCVCVQIFPLSLLLPCSLLCLIPSPHIYISLQPPPSLLSLSAALYNISEQELNTSSLANCIATRIATKELLWLIHTYYVLYGGHLVLMCKYT